MSRDGDELDKALVVAVGLSRSAVEAGLTVTALSPHRCVNGRYGCHFIQLWAPDGGLWAEASHETTRSVRRIVARFRKQAARG